MKLNDLSDTAAHAECRRLILVINAQRKKQDAWMNHDGGTPIEFDDNSGFVMGMVSLFRYARGENIPAFAVHDFLDELLTIMFGGLASGVLALPAFNKMQEKPWAHAWRLSELRFALEENEPMDCAQLAHLLGIKKEALHAQIQAQCGNFTTVPRGFLRTVFESMNERDS